MILNSTMNSNIRRLLVATRNAGKLEEIRLILNGISVDVVGLDDIDDVPELEEDGETFEENATHKALEANHLTDIPTLADDSGLEVDYLDGRPGVHSARYAPRSTNGYHGHIRKLLGELKDAPPEQRSARFRCVAALAHEGRIISLAEGTVEGRITEAPQGNGGFGYDPVFYVDELGKTFAEVSSETKNTISHRGRAFRAILPRIAELFSL